MKTQTALRGLAALLLVTLLLSASSTYISVPQSLTSSPNASQATAITIKLPRRPIDNNGKIMKKLSEMRVQPGSDLVVETHEHVQWDIDIELKSLQINGIFSCADKDVRLSANWIMLHGGNLVCGTETQPFTHNATITLSGTRSDENVMNMCGTKTICAMMGGTIDLHGIPHKQTWTKLNASAQAGSTQLTLAEPVDWQAGDRVVVATSSTNPSESEEHIIQSINGTAITLTQPLAYTHVSLTETHAGKTIDQRVEVGLLSHNIVIQGDESSDTSRFGCHVMSHGSSKLYITETEFYRCGQYGMLGRYPVHWHLAGDGSGQYLKNSSIHQSYHRFVTIHGSSNLLLQQNVAYDGYGTGYYLENGNEVNNTLERNLGILVHPIVDSDSTAPVVENSPSLSENKKHDWIPAIFYTINPQNHFRQNAAVGAEEGFGYWFNAHTSCPDPQPTNCGPVYANDGIQYSTLGEFSGNTAHSMQKRDYWRTDYTVSGSGLYTTNYKDEFKRFLFQNFTAFNNQGKAVVAVGKVLGGRFANHEWVNHGALAFEDTLIIGRSQAAGEHPGEPKGLSLGWNGQWVTAKDTVFVNFPDREKTAALYLSQGNSNMTFPYGIAENGSAWFPTFETLTFEQVTHRIIMEPINHTRTSETRPSDNFAVFDRDGSLSGQVGSVVLNTHISVTPACSVDTAANIARCPFGATAIDGSNLMRDDGIRHEGLRGWYQTTAIVPNHGYELQEKRSSFYVAGTKADEWIRLSLPYEQVANITINGQALPAVNSLAALDASSNSAYSMLNKRIYVKIVFNQSLLYVQDIDGAANYQARVEIKE